MRKKIVSADKMIAGRFFVAVVLVWFGFFGCMQKKLHFTSLSQKKKKKGIYKDAGALTGSKGNQNNQPWEECGYRDFNC